MDIAKEYKQIEWNGTDPKIMLTSYTKVFGNNQIGFRIMNCADGNLRLMDFTNSEMKSYIVKSVEAGKEMAQSLFDSYCDEILRNIYAD